MQLQALKKKAISYFGKGDIDACLELLAQYLNPSGKVFGELIQLSARYKRTSADDYRGVVSRANASLEYNRISQGLLALVNQLEQNDLGNGGNLEDPLEQIARDLRVEIPLTPLYLVNCDRRQPVRAFWQAFNDSMEQGQRFRFYFLPCCPSQQPESFAERIVHELLELELDSEFNAMDFRRRPGADERLLIEPLPVGLNLEGCKKAFKKYFAERFSLANSATSFEDYLRTGLPSLPWQYVAAAFKITDDEWNDTIMRPYLQWLMSTLRDTGPNVPNFLLFFIVTIKNAHRGDRQLGEAAREAQEGINALVAARSEVSGIATTPAPKDAISIQPLPPVPDVDLENWLEKLGNVSMAEKQEVIQSLVALLKDDEATLYQERQEFNMERIEGFQEKVYQAHKNK